MNRLIACAALMLLGASAIGCDTEAYCFADCASGAQPPDGGMPPDANVPKFDAGGPFIDLDSGTPDGALEEAGPPCEDTQSDPLNCGACGNVCAIAGAFPKCVAGACQIETCAEGRHDVDGEIGNGCEYKCTPSSGGETCDGVDNDCDTQVDEDFDLASDPNNCGICGNVCALTNADSACGAANGSPTCVVTSCKPGFYDINGIPEDGCEYACTPSACDGSDPSCVAGREVCDGNDNDCDGQINEADDPATPQVDGMVPEPCSDFCPNGVCQGRCTAGQRLCVGTQPVCLPGVLPGVESCNEQDDDCDGTPDNGFDLTSDANNCGDCGNKCTIANAVAQCQSSACSVKSCLSGYRDYDPSKSGCEVCAVYPTRTETCNGLDDDCDGIVDNAAAVAAQTPPAGYCRNKPGTPCASSQVQCQGTSGWVCIYGAGVELETNGRVRQIERLCDGVDGNCDGNVDEAFLDLGTACSEGTGACTDEGFRACDPANATTTYCDLSQGADPVPGAPFASEACNGVDDDCDGDVDEDAEDMVRVTQGGLDFFIDRYEASRPDAAAASAGSLETHACSKADALPWTNASYAEAQEACAAAGRRLCTAAELETACAGSAARTYPYGNAYQTLSCNGIDYTGSAAVPTGSVAQCVSPYGVFDLSGNVSEWTSTTTGNTGAPQNLPIQALHGGSYLSPANGLTCGFKLDRISTNAVTQSIGFRCCRTP